MNVLFEGFNTDEYYTNIDIATYDELVSNTIDMSDRDIEIITKNLKYEWRQDKALLIYPDPNNKSVWVLIIELEDDWFLVDFNLTYRVGVNWGPFNRTLYKCDQIEGLLKLLKDKDYLK
jgi:hypothetical protein